MNIQQKFRRLVDSLTMYTVTLYGLRFLVAAAIVLRFFNVITYSSTITLLISITVLIGACYAANFVLSKFYDIPVNQESANITGIILFLVLAMPSSPLGYIGLALAAIIAMASKYIFTWQSSLIFNPAAIGVFLVSIAGLGNAAWWVADPALVIPTLIVGFLILYKLRRFELFFAFLIPSLLLISFRSLQGGASVTEALSLGLTAYPLIFLGTVMLTEPITQPVARKQRLIYGALVGIIAGSAFGFGVFQTSPLTALLIGNIFAFLVSNRVAAKLTLVNKTKLTPTTYSFSFIPDKPLSHLPGQYIDLTIPGVKSNLRGNRRSFSIVSHSSTDSIEIGVKFYDNGSKYKDVLKKLTIGDRVLATNISGEFTIPKDVTTPLVFVAGGIGITPFIPMLTEVMNRKLGNQTTLYYFVRGKGEIAYVEVLKIAKKAGVNIDIRSGAESRLDVADIKRHENAVFYLSGPPGMVSSYKESLNKNGIKQIKTDYFTGY